MSSINIQSDFKDYYDYLADNKSKIVYERYRNGGMQRGSALKYLRSMGIKTIEIKPVNKFLFTDTKRVVVYTSPFLHEGKGKRVMEPQDAFNSYGNCICSKFYDSSTTVKYLQVGKRRFTLIYKKENNEELTEGKIVDISEQKNEYNRLIGLPIFSIDYIQDGMYMLATDFNEVENIKRLGIESLITPDQVVEEIKNALIAYNKV